LNATRRFSHTPSSAAIVVFLSAALVISSASVAIAHYVYEEAEVWRNASGQCLEIRSEISHGSGGGYSKGGDLTYQAVGPVQCFYQWLRGPGYLRMKYDLLKWNGSAWGYCRGINYYYNQTTVNIFDVYTNWGTQPPCGSGYYGTMSYGAVLVNGNWRGGSMWSGSGGHYLPA